MSSPRVRIVPAAAAVAFLLVAPLAAQEEGAAGPDAAQKPPWISADLPPGAYAEGDAPPPVERVFKKKYSKVWKKLVKLLEDEGLEISAMDKESGTIRTELKIFDEAKGPFRDVATRPPTATRKRPIRQWITLNRGRYALDISVARDQKTRVSVQPYIEERAYHVGEKVRLWAERHSNGTIENYFLDKLEQSL